jgi:hypothetical protein
LLRALRRGSLACVVSAWLAALSLAVADGVSPNAHALAVAESALSYCAPLDPAAAEKIRRLITQLAHGANEKQLAELRSDDEYRKTYDSVVEFTGKIDPRNAKRFCAQASASRQ